MDRSSCEVGNARESLRTHSLLEEMRGIVHRLKSAGVPIEDGADHLIPLCETLEAILRHGLKKPNSWFGLNKQDYWSWIEPLQDYYFNQKENPLLRDVVKAVAQSNKTRSVVASGRCFIRIALCQKLISVPIEHLAQNQRLTQYWYSRESIIGDAELRDRLMEVLFEVTDIDFQLAVSNSSFLNETWVIPHMQDVSIAPVKTLSIKLSYIENRALIVDLEKDSLAEKAGVEVGDVLDELCGSSVQGTSHGKLKQILISNSVDSTDFVIVKKHLPDGSLFLPILQRQLESDELAGIHRKHKRKLSAKIQSKGQSTEYSLVLLGKELFDPNSTKPLQEIVNEAISHVLASDQKVQNVIASVSSSELALCTADSREEIHRWKMVNVSGCGRGESHKTCIALSTSFQSNSHCVYILEASSIEFADTICCQIAKSFTAQTDIKKTIS